MVTLLCGRCGGHMPVETSPITPILYLEEHRYNHIEVRCLACDAICRYWLTTAELIEIVQVAQSAHVSFNIEVSNEIRQARARIDRRVITPRDLNRLKFDIYLLEHGEQP